MWIDISVLLTFLLRGQHSSDQHSMQEVISCSRSQLSCISQQCMGWKVIEVCFYSSKSNNAPILYPPCGVSCWRFLTKKSLTSRDQLTDGMLQTISVSIILLNHPSLTFFDKFSGATGVQHAIATAACASIVSA